MNYSGIGMTAKRCADCKYTKGIGYNFWCGEGHTEYEVFGAETNCPYYEYHDWSKGVPSMTAKRFKFNGRTNCIEYDNKSILLDSYGEDIEEILNELHKENMMLKGEVAHYKLILLSLEEQAKRLSKIHCVGDKE